MLKPGTYQLKYDVSNPNPDRRVRDDWTKAPVWKAGLQLIVMERHSHVQEITRIYRVGDRFWILHAIDPGPTYELIALAAEEIPETIEAMFTRLDVEGSAKDFLRYMFESKQWCKEQLEHQLKRYQAK